MTTEKGHLLSHVVRPQQRHRSGAVAVPLAPGSARGGLAAHSSAQKPTSSASSVAPAPPQWSQGSPCAPPFRHCGCSPGQWSARHQGGRIGVALSCPPPPRPARYEEGRASRPRSFCRPRCSRAQAPLCLPPDGAGLPPLLELAKRRLAAMWLAVLLKAALPGNTQDTDVISQVTGSLPSDYPLLLQECPVCCLQLCGSACTTQVLSACQPRVLDQSVVALARVPSSPSPVSDVERLSFQPVDLLVIYR